MSRSAAHWSCRRRFWRWTRYRSRKSGRSNSQWWSNRENPFRKTRVSRESRMTSPWLFCSHSILTLRRKYPNSLSTYHRAELCNNCNSLNREVVIASFQLFYASEIGWAAACKRVADPLIFSRRWIVLSFLNFLCFPALKIRDNYLLTVIELNFAYKPARALKSLRRISYLFSVNQFLVCKWQ